MVTKKKKKEIPCTSNNTLQDLNYNSFTRISFKRNYEHFKKRTSK